MVERVGFTGAAFECGDFDEQFMAFSAAGHRMQEFIGFKRLAEVVHGPVLDRLDRQLGGGIRGNHEDGKLRVLLFYLLQEFEPRHASQPGVGDHHEELLAAKECEARFGRLGEAHLVALASKYGLQRYAHVAFVVNEEERGGVSLKRIAERNFGLEKQ